jgi:hypothetical protein
MAGKNGRAFPCRYEELPVLCEFAARSLRTDLEDFKKYSPKFTAAFATDFEKRIAECYELVGAARTPQEAAKLKEITGKLHNAMMQMSVFCKQLEGYIMLSGGAIKRTPAEFGITRLRQSIRRKDVEGALAALTMMKEQLAANKALLSAEGMGKQMPAAVDEALVLIKEERQNQYRQKLQKKAVSGENLQKLNALYAQLQIILQVGKIVYAGQAEKIREYTFSVLKRQISTRNSGRTAEAVEPAADSAASAE